MYTKHFQVANLREHGAVVDVQDSSNYTPLLHGASASRQVDIMRLLLDHGADANARNRSFWTPLYRAAYNIRLETFQTLLEDINLQTASGKTSLHGFLKHGSFSTEGEAVAIVRRLLEHGADPHNDQPWLTYVMAGPTLRLLMQSWTANVGRRWRFLLFSWMSRRRPKAEVRYLVCISKSEISYVGQGHRIDQIRSMRM